MIDFLNVADAAIIGSIIALMEVIKAIDSKQRLGRFYPLFVLMLGLAAAAFKTIPWTWQGFGYNAIVYAGASSFVYKFGKTTVLGR